MSDLTVDEIHNELEALRAEVSTLKEVVVDKTVEVFHLQQHVNALQEAMADEVEVLTNQLTEDSLIVEAVSPGEVDGVTQRHFSLPLKDGYLIVANVGSDEFEPSVEHIEAVTEAINIAAEEILGKDVKYAVLGLRYDITVDAFKVKRV
jgi:hypothetical protein